MEEKPKYDASNITVLTLFEAIRKRPVMYIGDTQNLGALNLLKELLLELMHDTNWRKMTFQISANDEINVHLDHPIEIQKEKGEYVFITKLVRYIGFPAVVALSSEIILRFSNVELHYKKGELVSEKIRLDQNFEIKFTIDTDVLPYKKVYPKAIATLIERLVLLSKVAREIEFISPNQQIQIFQTGKGMVDLIDKIGILTEPLCEPISLTLVDDDSKLKVRVVLAFHSSHVNKFYTFIGNQEVPNGGTHIEGFEAGLRQFLKIKNVDFGYTWIGLMAILAISHPAIVYKGCTRAKVGNEEFVVLFQKLTFDALIEKKDEFLEMMEGLF